MSMDNSISWEVKSFEGLTNKELYNILHLRAEVFIIEQNCPYQDMDGKDIYSFHLIGTNDRDQLMAYARLLPADISFREVSIGRVVTSPSVRKTGVGVELMKTAIQIIEEKHGKVPIRIGAQLYLKKFYERFGFIKDSEMYLEDGIEHIEMLRTA
ncbi:MAG TPA: GNAT family N-acetyltransferase [Bacteroidia bacterium]|nr:GNAT family N-acetyltransferase [Bacteroidia bacterium]